MNFPHERIRLNSYYNLFFLYSNKTCYRKTHFLFYELETNKNK